MAIEQPKYSVEVDQKPFQIREYAPYVAAEVTVTGERSDAISAGFRILAGYIFGGNVKKSSIAMTAPVTQAPQSEKIAMTAPVTQAPQSEKIAMTAPVTQSAAGDGWTVQFMMPSSYTLETLPKPDDARIHFVEMPARRVAVVTFSGFYSPSNLGGHKQQLLDFVKSRGLKPVGEPAYAFYDPPWIPWFWRTNEVMVEVGK